DLLLRIENGADDKLHRLSGAQGAEVRTDAAALAVDRMTRQATQLRTPENFRPGPGISMSPDFGGECRDFRGRQVRSAAVETGGCSENPGQLLVASAAGAHQTQSGFGGAIAGRRGRQRIRQGDRSTLTSKERRDDLALFRLPAQAGQSLPGNSSRSLQ